MRRPATHGTGYALGYLIATSTPVQRLGVLMLAAGAALFVCGFVGHDTASRVYDAAVHEIKHYHWYDYAAELGLWLAPVGAVLWFGYPILAIVARWVRTGR